MSERADCGRIDRFYVATPLDPTAPVSGVFPSSAAAEGALGWLRQGNSMLVLIRRLNVYQVCD